MNGCQEQKPSPERGEITVLLVEDDDGDAKAIRRAFKKARIGNQLVRTNDGVEALELLRGEHTELSLIRPYVMLVDIYMPRMDGIELVRTIRADPKLKSMVVFMLTTSDDHRDRIESYDLNVAGYIVKELAGEDFWRLTTLLDNYWRVVCMPI
ncbi:response regulator [Rhodopirellula sp. MGV]|uniref:response regulator n=1 Tax=Rhodopirellula sp. MGV TaxID=2023130 RepID=UPI000B95DBA5|nr:response regulator [Rhodopirellula sp. MGV]OYP33863.1 two-component system response regulator [Rhodopirellula sp. MGV]PNY37283.1 response regulator [Rhodopirellula baltica]